MAKKLNGFSRRAASIGHHPSVTRDTLLAPRFLSFHHGPQVHSVSERAGPSLTRFRTTRTDSQEVRLCAGTLEWPPSPALAVNMLT
jgi:hypothetical protein